MKIVASDFDGTLIHRGVISDSDRHAIEGFRRAGNKFGVVTGRDMDLARLITIGQNFHPDFLICCTGAVILDNDGKILYEKRGRIGSFLHDIFHHALSLGAEGITLSDGLLKYFVDVTQAIPFDLSAFGGFTQANVAFPDPEIAEVFTDYVRTYHSESISVHRNGRHVDMPPPSTSKVTGIYEYARRFDAPEIYAVGDNVNDLPMIREFCGFAVSNAVDALKAEADYQCDRVGDMIEYIMKLS